MSTHTQRTSLRGLRTFCVAAGHQSFRTAADELHVTASAVSHQIKSLEQEMGVTLFDRNGRALSLTPAGRAFYESIDPLIAELDVVTRKHRARGMPAALKVSVQPFFATELFVPRLSEFTQRYPDIELQVDTSDESSEKIPAAADVSIRLLRSAPSADADLLFPLRLLPAGSPRFSDDLIVRDKKILSDFPIIVHETTPTAWFEWAKENDVVLPSTTKTVRLDSMIAVARAAERGMGAALVPVPLANDWFANGSLVKLFDRSLLIDGGYYVVCNETRGNREPVRKLKNWVLETFDPTTRPA